MFALNILQMEIDRSRDDHAGNVQEKKRLTRMLEHKVCYFVILIHLLPCNQEFIRFRVDHVTGR